MSRIGKKPIVIPPGVTINIDNNRVTAKGKLGELFLEVDASIKLKVEDTKIILTPVSEDRKCRSRQGLYRSLLYNIVVGVSEGFTRTLKIVGVGYRVTKKGKVIELLVGYSSPAVVNETDDVTFEVPDATTIVIKGIDKQKVGEMAAKIRSIRKPEPYKGKGIKYEDEIIKRKVGKAAVTVGK